MKRKCNRRYLTDIKHVPAWIILLIFILMLNSCLTFAANDFERLNRAVFKVNSTDKEALFTYLQKYGFSLLHEITPSTFIFEYKGYQGNKTIQDACQTVLDVFPNELVDAEPVRIYENTMKPWDPGKDSHVDALENIPLSDKDRNYGMGISKVWSRGYSGKGVTVAVTGVGIEELLDLRKNIDRTLSFNFVSNKSDVTPEFFKNSQRNALLATDHGNRVAGIVAAEKGNNVCSAGILYDCNLVGLKMYAVRMLIQPSEEPTASHFTTSDIVSRALIHHLHDIDIYVNAWIPTKPFDSLDLATREAIAYGATTGRHGSGAVYVVPAGPAGNMLSNNIHTITVGMFGINGTVSDGSVTDSSVLTSGLGDGNSLTSSNMATTSHYDKCVTGFKGYSAAVAQVGGIIGLGIEANPSLSLRDIQHLLVKASAHRSLETAAIFRRNGAGHYFNEMFGFGLLNADKFVSLSEKSIPASPLIMTALQPYKRRGINASAKTVEFCYSCDAPRDPSCLTTVEHVSILVDIGTPSDNVKMELKSPSGTRSVVMDLQESQVTSIPIGEAKLVSVHFWDELAFGIWVLTVESKRLDSEVHISNSALTLYGTRNMTISSNGHGSFNSICKRDQAAVTTTPAKVSPTTTTKPDTEGKTNIPIIVIIPVGVVIGCGLLVFIFMRGGSHGPVSSFGKPSKKEKKDEEEPVLRRHVNDTPLHRQVSLLRQQSVRESTAEDIIGEEEEEEEEEELNKSKNIV